MKQKARFAERAKIDGYAMKKYTYSLQKNQALSHEQLKMLCEGVGISDGVIAAHGYWTITNRVEFEQCGLSSTQYRVLSLLVLLFGADASNSLYFCHPGNPSERRSGRGR